MIAGLVLAAGESSRMGRDKALLSYRGRTFLESIILNLHDAGLENTFVVLGHHAKQIRQAVKLADVEVVINPNYRRGQTSSLQAGLRALQGLSPEGVMLCLVDHPAVPVEVIRKLRARFEQANPPVAIPTCEGRRGHPIVIGRALFAELLALSPDEGANSVVRKYRDTTQFVQVEEAGILVDVDDPVTYRELMDEGNRKL